MIFRRAILVSTALALSIPVVSYAAPKDSVPGTAIDIPFETFTLANGLRVIVHTDRTVKVVAVNVAYDVGSKHEPTGRTGFAHLFEHLMFTGSENAPGEFNTWLTEIGATANNGMTQSDRTVYYETVPTPALERMLFLESDRMGHLLNALSQARLDEQRGVVKNEKRQGENNPGGLVWDRLTERLYPRDHAYGHSVIGSMADLDAARLDDVRHWFRTHYGPNNAVLTLAGDIDVATARTLVQRYFGAIPAGPRTVGAPEDVPSLQARVDDRMSDAVSATTLFRAWTLPGKIDPAAPALEAAAATMASVGASPLEETLVRREKLFNWVGADANLSNSGGMFVISGEIASGVDPAVAGRRLDEAVAAFLQTGPTADALQRYIAVDVAAGLQELGSVSGKSFALSDGELIGAGPDYYKRRLAMLAVQTPASVRAAATIWLGRPVYALTLSPGTRTGYVESTVREEEPAPAAKPVATPVATGTRSAMPGIGTFPDLVFPQVERARLRNGIELVHARRMTSPMTYVSLDFDAGTAADRLDRIGTQALMLSLLDEGTTTRDAATLIRDRERLGAQIGNATTGDRTRLTLTVPSDNLAPAINLLAGMIRTPAFPAEAVVRRRAAQLAQIASEMADPGSVANRIRLPMFDAASPYAKGLGAGDAAAVARIDRNDLIAFKQAWLRPDKAKVFVVSDRPLSQVRDALDAAFGDWQPGGSPGTKSFDPAPRPASPQIVLVDRPGAAQSVILAGQPLPLKGPDEQIALDVANDGLGGGFGSRLNQDLRQRRHWSYGISTALRTPLHATTFGLSTSVQIDRTGAAIAAIRGIVGEYRSTKPVTQAEFDLAVTSRIRALPGSFATPDAIMSALRDNDLYRRPDDYPATLTARYRGLSLDRARSAIGAIDPDRMFWVVVSDASKVRSQIETLGLPVTVVPMPRAETVKKD